MKKEIHRKIAAVALAMYMMMFVPSFAVSAAPNESNEADISLYSSSIPQNARQMNLTVNGQRVLGGRVFETGGSTYVPMFKLADWLGNFKYTYSYENGEVSGHIEGLRLDISATVGKLYICANGRYFYTGSPVMLYDNEMYVPIRPLVKALNCYVSWSADSNSFIVRSGDTSLLSTAEQVYRESDVYWLARIISAEAGGESFKGKMAVGNVVLNRMRSAQFPNTIYGVIFDKKYGTQFAPVANGTVYNAPTAESIIAAKACIEGYSLSSDILYFFNPSLSSGSWIKSTRKYAFTIGNHAFYN